MPKFKIYVTGYNPSTNLKLVHHFFKKKCRGKVSICRPPQKQLPNSTPYCIIVLQQEDDYNHVLENGPYFFKGKKLFIDVYVNRKKKKAQNHNKMLESNNVYGKNQEHQHQQNQGKRGSNFLTILNPNKREFNFNVKKLTLETGIKCNSYAVVYFYNQEIANRLLNSFTINLEGLRIRVVKASLLTYLQRREPQCDLNFDSSSKSQNGFNFPSFPPKIDQQFLGQSNCLKYQKNFMGELRKNQFRFNANDQSEVINRNSVSPRISQGSSFNKNRVNPPLFENKSRDNQRIYAII